MSLIIVPDSNSEIVTQETVNQAWNKTIQRRLPAEVLDVGPYDVAPYDD